jgi:6-phosphogluconolactonase
MCLNPLPGGDWGGFLKFSITTYIYKLKRPFQIYKTTRDLAEAFATELIKEIREASGKKVPFTIALSGGSTPAVLYSVLAEKYSNTVDWRYVHFFWGDERCVPPDDPESNFGAASSIFLRRIDISEGNIHRIRGEANPSDEAVRYSSEIIENTRTSGGLPVFDHIILGMGEDGHTASIFPSGSELLYSDKLCEVATHPLTGQKRITVTGKVINNSDAVTFFVTGHSKAEIVEQIIKKDSDFPASFILPSHGRLVWLLDEKAGRLIVR